MDARGFVQGASGWCQEEAIDVQEIDIIVEVPVRQEPMVEEANEGSDVPCAMEVDVLDLDKRIFLMTTEQFPDCPFCGKMYVGGHDASLQWTFCPNGCHPHVSSYMFGWREATFQRGFIPTGNLRFSGKLLAQKLSERRNNLLQQTEAAGIRPIRRNELHSSMPPITQARLHRLNGAQMKSLMVAMDGQEWLPLKIAPSNVVGAGKGMFATARIKATSVVLPYLGEYKAMIPGVEEPYNDSIFYVGAVKSQGLHGFDVFLDPCSAGNSARFVNSNKGQNNCYMVLVFAPPLNSPVFVLIAMRDILPGQELFYSYGDTYLQEYAE